MGRKMTWKEMKKAFPNEWLRIGNYKLDDKGEIKEGTVLYHSKSKNKVYSHPLTGKSEAFWYTGKSTFSGLRSHATHNCI